MKSSELIIELKEFLKNPSGFILLTGMTGRGKSYVAMHIYYQFTPYELPMFDHDIAWFMNMSELPLILDKARKEYGDTVGLMEEMSGSNLLILDDLGTMRDPSPSFADFIYLLVEKRHQRRDTKTTVVTTNLTSSQIRERYGDAFLSRIASGKNYKLEGEDLRISKKAL
jgi:DNA replication protein DnaC